MAFAKSDMTNNFAMRILTPERCCQGEHTDPKHLVHAKELVRRFTFVLDIACLNEGITAVAQALGMEPRQLPRALSLLEERALRYKPHPPVSERIPYPEVYDFLVRRNRLDMELYEWGKEISFVRCSHP